MQSDSNQIIKTPINNSDTPSETNDPIYELLNPLKNIIQKTYFDLNPLNPNNNEHHFQELLRENLIINFNVRVHREMVQQKKSIDFNGNEIYLDNKSEIFDLAIDKYNIILELKACAELDESHHNQLLSYLNQSNFNYGLLIHFTKPAKKIKKCVVTLKCFKKREKVTNVDKYGNEYKTWKFDLISEFKTENYLDVVGGYFD
tara:strand:+ start:31 stop:636 length:606 start_codon:yes stop_codon:yes gene_type:complete